MSSRLAINLNIAQKTVLTLAALSALAIPVALGVLTAPATMAQSSPTGAPGFEVASIRPCTAEDRPAFTGNGRGTGRAATSASPDLFRAVCAPVARLILDAYIRYADGRALSQHQLGSSSDHPIQGGPDWVYSVAYTIEAKPSSPQTHAMMNGPMLRALLEDRFKLKSHRENKEVPAYALVAARGGPRLQATPKGGCTPVEPGGPPPPLVPGQPLPCGYMGSSEKGGIEAVGVPVTSLFTILSNQLRRPIVDRTGLTGLFNYHFDVEPGPPNSSPQLEDPAYQDTVDVIASALNKLGLKLQPAKASTESIVIDHVERPSGN